MILDLGAGVQWSRDKIKKFYRRGNWRLDNIPESLPVTAAAELLDSIPVGPIFPTYSCLRHRTVHGPLTSHTQGGALEHMAANWVVTLSATKLCYNGDVMIDYRSRQNPSPR